MRFNTSVTIDSVTITGSSTVDFRDIGAVGSITLGGSGATVSFGPLANVNLTNSFIWGGTDCKVSGISGAYLFYFFFKSKKWVES